MTKSPFCYAHTHSFIRIRHEAGLPYLNHTFLLSQLERKSLKANAVGDVIEKSCLTGVRGKRHYHALSRGYLANEIFRRVDAKNRYGRREEKHALQSSIRPRHCRTMGEFVRETFYEERGIDVHLGVEEGSEVQQRIVDLSFEPPEKVSFSLKGGNTNSWEKVFPLQSPFAGDDGEPALHLAGRKPFFTVYRAVAKVVPATVLGLHPGSGLLALGI